MKALVAIAAGAVLTVSVGGLAYANATPSWEDEVRSAVSESMANDPETAQSCSALALFDIDTAEDLVAMVEVFGDDEIDLDSALADFGGASDALLAEIPEDVTGRDVLLVAADEVVEQCG